VIQQPQFARPREVDPGAWERQRRDQVGEKVPAAKEVYSFMDLAGWHHLYPMDLATMSRSEEPFQSPAHAVEHFAHYPGHGAGLITGPQDPSWGYLAVHIQRPGAWAAWLHKHGVVKRRNPGDYREKYSYDLRPYGAPVLVNWQEIPSTDPYAMPKTFPTVAGDSVDQVHRLTLLESLTHGRPESWLLFAYQGERTWRGKTLDDGLGVQAPGSTVPVAGGLDGFRLAVLGNLQRPEPNAANVFLPDWLESQWGVKSS